MGLLEALLARLSPKARSRIAQQAAKGAVREVGDRVFDKADEIREDFEQAAKARRDARAREQAAEEKARRRVSDERAIDDELAALKAALGEE